MVDAAVRTLDHSGSAAYGTYSSGRASNSAGSTASHSRRLLAHRSMTRRPRSLPKGVEVPPAHTATAAAVINTPNHFAGAVWLASAAWPHPKSFPIIPGGDRSGHFCACSIDCPILAPDLRILLMSASVTGR